MTKLIIILVIWVVIAQIVSVVRKKVKQTLSDSQSPIKIGLDILKDQGQLMKAKADTEQKTTRLIMETKDKADVLPIKSTSYDEKAFGEEIGSYPKPEEIQKAKPKQKPSSLSFTSKSIVQGIVISEILKRPKY